MKKQFYFALIAAIFLILGTISCQEPAHTSEVKELAFNYNGKFKIVQFTDIHFRANDPASDRATKLMNEVLDAERPDLVIITGDIIYSKPAKDALDGALAPIIKREIPWAVTFGNHDDEAGWSRGEVMNSIMQMPHCLSLPGDTNNIKGVGNYIIELKDNKKENIKALLYFFDSGSYTPIKGVGSYDWFDLSQILWYKDKSESYTAANNNEVLPALAFFHIPFPEFNLMATSGTKLVGERRESECHGHLNTGMFAAMRQAGDVMGVFVGHDHDNDYIGSYYDIALAYGRFSGGNTEYNNLGLNGCRVIELEEDKHEFNTYIRLLGGEKIYEVSYPGSFGED